MKAMTKKNLEEAFAGESQAHMKYAIYAEAAEKAGFPEVARLFRAISFAERVHATNHFRELGGIGDTSKNLADAAGGESYEVEEMYPAFDAVARAQQEKGAVRSIFYALEAEKIHEAMYREAKRAVDTGADDSKKNVYVCPVCGHTVIGGAPERCPVCNVPREQYREF